MNKHIQEYKHWHIDYNDTRPVTGRWVAERFKVRLCANTLEQLKAMIDLKEAFYCK